MDDLDASSEFNAATPHSLDGTPAGSETARGAALGSNPFEDQVFNPMRPEAVDELRAIADRMARAGYSCELADAYCGIRRDLLDEYLSVLGVERLSIDEVQRIEWKLFNDKMKKWVHRVKTVVRVLLAGERHLCDQVLATPKLFRLIMSDDPRAFPVPAVRRVILLHHIRIYDSEYPNSLNPKMIVCSFHFVSPNITR
ncbi:exocyst complex component EXO70B1-like [Panicum miliaceum]|uniref:Exocyst complex component EXO70B1-like n=1 Tax=Panicum miliaceum TaxID=4540 RepID=A0A3L6TLD8_PANMI|nr:exocyst complex component EXO70B1-like [Panicum miliaceum]